MKKRIGISLMVVGAIFLALALALLWYNSNENSQAEKQAKTIVDKLVTVADENESQREEDPFDTDMRVADLNGYGYIGYLVIPELDLELPVMDQWDNKRLKISPCRYYGSAKTDNMVIAAHNYKSHFGYIGRLSLGSTVLFTDVDGKDYVYSVTGIETVKPTDVDKVKDTGDDLVLYTCTYSGSARVVIRCNRTN